MKHLSKGPKNKSFGSSRFSKRQLTVFGVFFALAGGYFIYSSFAAGIVTNTGIPIENCPDQVAGNCRPYDPASAWNTPIGANPALDPNSASFIQQMITKTPNEGGGITDANGSSKVLTSDVNQYTQPVYFFDSTTPTYTVKTFDNGSFGGSGPGFFNIYDAGDKSRTGAGSPWSVSMPIPQKLFDDMAAGKLGLTSASGNDAQVILWDPNTGIEYGLWQVMTDATANPAAGHLTATNGYKYHTTNGYYGRMAGAASGNPSSGGGRGAGTSYFAGLVRPWEIQQGHIDHALSWAMKGPAPTFVYPATKSDGGNFGGIAGLDAPEGARLQLDPNFTDADFTSWGLNPTAKIIAKALQDYGAYIIDNSGSTKVYLEQQDTANWDTSQVNRNTLSKIPLNRFRVVAAPADPTASPSPSPTPTPTPSPTPSPSSAPTTGPTNITATNGNGQAIVNWTKEAGATSYKLRYRASGTTVWNEIAVGDVSTNTITGLANGTDYNLQMQSLNSAGNSAWVPSNPVKMDPLASYTNPPPAGSKQGDLNNDGLVNIFDLSILMSDYGKTKAAAANQNSDINNDNNINIFDMSILLSKYGA